MEKEKRRESRKEWLSLILKCCFCVNIKSKTYFAKLIKPHVSLWAYTNLDNPATGLSRLKNQPNDAHVT
jgi:hypothetical protein